MLRNISNVSKYATVNCFIIFFSLKGLFIPLIAASFVSFFSFYNLKRFLTSLVIFSSIFLFPSSLELFIIICCEKKKKIDVYYIP